MWHIDAPLGAGFWPYLEGIECPAPTPTGYAGFNAIFDEAAKTALDAFSGGNRITICSVGGFPQTRGYIYQTTDILSSIPPANQRIWVAAIYIDNGVKLSQGTEIVDSLRRRWELKARQSGSQWMEFWSIEEIA